MIAWNGGDPVEFDPQAFQSFEARGWEDVARSYSASDVVLSLTGQVAAPLAEAVAATAEQGILYLASGPGLAAEEARKRGAKVVGVDIAASMVHVAKSRVPGARFLQASADRLPFSDRSFAGIMCGFGLPHFSDPVAVFKEAHRILVQGGRVAFATWCSPDKVPFFGIVFTAVVEHGTLDVPIPEGPDMFQFANEERTNQVLASAGFHEIGFEELPIQVEVVDASQAMDLVSRATVRTRSLFEAQSGEAKEAIRASVTEAVEAMREGSVIRVPMPAVLITGTSA